MAGEWIVLVWILGLSWMTQGAEVNIARDKRAWTTLGNFPKWTADKAVDGDNDIYGGERTCFHGEGSPSDWNVDLGQPYQLYLIRVYMWINREHRTADSIVYLDENPAHKCYTFPSIIRNNPKDLTCNETGRYVTIRNPGTGFQHDDALNICEVEIYGCRVGTYGRYCTNSCGQCASKICNRWTGLCNGDCVAGYRGNKCDTVCSETYGVNCRHTCADRKCSTDTSSCDRVTGSCDTGCLPGWMGADCITECGPLNYGNGCARLCADRNCNGSSSCNHVTGSCDSGCLAGWEGTDCQQACSESYGVNCSEKCVDRKCNTDTLSCDHITGSCDTGCLPGWTKTDCTEECDKQYYGNNCSNHCEYRHCRGNSTCDHVTGSCDEGCKAGWVGTDCSRACDDQHYGMDCASLCADRHCEGNSSCNHVNGSCDQGCSQGWDGDDCRDQGMKSGHESAASPPVPALVGGVIGAVVLILVLVLVLVIVLIRRRRKPENQRELHEWKINGDKDQCTVYENIALEEDRGKSVAAKAFGHVHLNGQAGGASEDYDSKSVDTLEEEGDYDSPVRLVEGPDAPERNYYNLDNIDRGHVIDVSQLEVRVREFEENTELIQEEFQQLPDTFLHPYDESQKTGNNTKNRFKGYYPYNYNRVVLHDDGDGVNGDYINASYLDGYNSKNRYIAAQGPYKDEIVVDFWRMIWQEGCEVVVMVTGLVEGGKVKCLRYWPEAGSLTYCDVTVTMETETKLSDYTITKLAVQHRKGSKKRHVTHFHFTSWPDHGVPNTSCLLQYMWRINSTSGQQKHPIVVHCSAGIGRTGTYIAVDSLVSQATTEGTVDVISFVSNMRSQRKNMIQTKEQYLFVYQAVMAAVVEGDTSIDADVIRQINLDQLTEMKMGNKTVQQHLEVMARFSGIGPSDDTITVPSYTSRTRFLVKTSSDKEEVWNQLYNSGSRTLVTWGDAEKSYLPSPDRPVSTSILTAKLYSSTVISNNVTLSEVRMKRKDEKESTLIHMYQVAGSASDPSISVLIDSLLQWTEQSGSEINTIVSRSITETRLLILIVNITSRLQDDGKVDVISNMRRLQSLLGGPHFTANDVRLCVEFSQRQLESLGTYANL